MDIVQIHGSELGAAREHRRRDRIQLCRLESDFPQRGTLLEHTRVTAVSAGARYNVAHPEAFGESERFKRGAARERILIERVHAFGNGELRQLGIVLKHALAHARVRR